MVFINNKPSFYIGIDPHKFIHTACVINYDTDKLLTFTFKNEPQYYDEALNKIIKVTKSKDIIFGLEDTQSSGLLFSYFLTKFGFDVKQVNPAMANAYRKSLPTYHKSDDYDAYCVAKVLKDNYKSLLSFKHELVYTNIKLLINVREQITKTQKNNYMTLHQQLSKVYPGYTKFFSLLKKRSALAFFLHFPAPRYLKGYNAESLSTKMREYTTRFPITKSEKILASVRSNPIPFVDEIVEEEIVEIINDIYLSEKRIDNLESKLVPLIEQTGYKLETIPGVKIVTAARLISEIGNINNFKNANQLAKYAGVSPISVGSGGKNKELVSKGGNRRLRGTLYFLAVGMIAVSVGKNPRNEVFRTYFLKRVAEGKTNSQALICIMRQLVRIIYSMMKNRSEWVELTLKDKENRKQLTVK